MRFLLPVIHYGLGLEVFDYPNVQNEFNNGKTGCKLVWCTWSADEDSTRLQELSEKLRQEAIQEAGERRLKEKLG